jgi:3-oxoacyl-[acyl-carrier protein] reductase
VTSRTKTVRHDDGGNAMKLEDRVALVTGSGSGIGRAIALRFADEGARVIVAGRTQVRLEETLAAMGSGPAKGHAIQADVSNRANVDAMFAEIDRVFGRIDVLVNNAGIGVDDVEQFNRTVDARGAEAARGGPIQTQWHVTREMSDEIWRRMIAIHLDGTFFCARGALRLMTPAKGGSIINVSSTAGLTGQEGAPHYSAAKAGVLGFTRALAREVASEGIRVNALCPGFVDTAMSEGYSPAFKRGTLTRIPLRRWGTADEVASAALFLASEDGAYFTGQCLSPNGGIFMS